MKIRKMLALSLFCFILMVNTGCLAENVTGSEFFVADTNGQYEDYIISTVALNGDLYMLSNQKLYTYSLINRERQTILDWGTILSELNHGQDRSELLEDFSKTRVDRLISASDAVYGINERYGTIFRLEENQFIPDTVIDPGTALIADCSGSIFKTDQHLYYVVHANDYYEEDMLFDYNITEQLLDSYEVGSIYEIALFHDKVALLRESRQSTEGLEITTFDTQTKQFSTIAVFTDRNINGLCYSSEYDCLMYLTDDTVYALHGKDLSNPLGYINFSASSLQYDIHSLSSNALALVSPYGIYIREFAADQPNHQTLRMSLFDSYCIPSFIAHYPEIKVSVTDAYELDEQDLVRQFLDGTLQLDVIEVDASTIFPVLANRGYLMNLTGSAIILSDNKQLYPVAQEAIGVDGMIFGVPSKLVVESWAYNEELWNSILPDSVPPRTFQELVDLCDKWISDIIDNDEDYCMLYPSSVFMEALYMDMIELYIEQYDLPNVNFSFDTEVFRDMLTALKGIEGDYELIANRMLISDNEEPLLYSHYNSFLRSDVSPFSDEWIPMLPIALSEQQIPKVPAHMTVYVVNSASEHKQEALCFLEFIASYRTYADERLLKPSINTPVQRASFEDEYAALRDNVNYLYSLLATCDESMKSDIENTIALQESLLENANANKWQLAEDEIAIYRQIAEHMQIRQTTFARMQYSTGLQLLYPIIQRYIEGNIDMETLINMLNERVNMILNE